MGILANENAISSGGYQISNSLRFQSASSQYLSRTPASVSNRKTWTWSGWVKRGLLTQGIIFSAGSGTENTLIFFNSSTQQLQFNCVTASTNRIVAQTAAVFRDPSAWYHIIYAVDTTQATSSNGIKIYVNGIQQTLTISTYTQNVDTAVNNTVAQQHGALSGYAAEYFDGYMAEVNFIDGQALTPSSFGTTDATSGQWVAAKYTGTYGTNGFYLPFSNGTSTTTLGADSSGNSNNWTLTNFTRSAGVSDCWMVDVPSGNGGASGTQPNSNYCVLNPLINTAGYVTVSKANLQVSIGAADKVAFGTMTFPTSGKYYYEYTVSTVGAASVIGVATDSVSQSSGVGFASLTARMYQQNGQKFNGATGTAYGTSFTTGDVIGVAVDMDAGTIVFYKNNTSQGTAYSDLAGGTWFPAVYINTATGNFNFGQRSFAYTPPTGFKALCTANLPVATIKQGNKYMDATLYTGNGSTQSITNAGGFKPDLVWVKSRSAATDNKLTDSVRGVQKGLISNTTGAETTDTNGLTAFNSNGWSLGTDTVYNANAGSFVGWQWQAGQGSTSSNTNGSITSTTSVNATAGFSVVTYTGNATTGATVGHGLGVKPAMVILKTRAGGTEGWPVWQKSLASESYFLRLNETSATYTALSNRWTAFSSTTITLGNNTETNGSGYTYVAYCFAEIAGFSKFGSYTGNGSADGPFVYCGFRPKYVMVKYSSSADNWDIFDSVRNPYNLTNNKLYANLSDAESADAFSVCDLLSNGFKLRGTGNQVNANGGTYIYMAFAESPFQNSNSR